jgi:hypothetical protein
MDNAKRTAEMNLIAAATQQLIKSAGAAGLARRDAVVAALIGVFSIIRVDRLNEEGLLEVVRQAVPKR